MQIKDLILQSKNEIEYQLNNLNEEDILLLTSRIRSHDIIYITGIGKSESVAIHISNLLKSIGIKCFHLNILNSLHGDIGTIEENDLLILLSKSGNTEELISKIESFRLKKCSIIGITNNEYAELHDLCNDTITLPFCNELNNKKIPTNSCISFILFFNIIISLLSTNITKDTYLINHSAGSIGESLKI